MMMKRTLQMLTAILEALMLSSGMALAATITCQAGVDCLGTSKADVLKGTAGKDLIYGRRGGDTLRGLGEFDELHGQPGKDRLFGGPEKDFRSAAQATMRSVGAGTTRSRATNWPTCSSADRAKIHSSAGEATTK